MANKLEKNVIIDGEKLFRDLYELYLRDEKSMSFVEFIQKNIGLNRLTFSKVRNTGIISSVSTLNAFKSYNKIDINDYIDNK